MKLFLLSVLALGCGFSVSSALNPLEAVEAKLKQLQAQRAECQKRGTTMTGPEKEENDQLIASIALIERADEAKLKELRLRLDTHRPCPICGGKLVPVESVGYDRSKPSRNLEIWNSSGCGNPSFFGKSPVCTRCWFAQSITQGWWTRSSIDRDTFVQPLTAGIHDFPIPHTHKLNSPVIYSQAFKNAEHRDDDVYFSYAGSKEYLDEARSYARLNGLNIRISRNERHGVEIHVTSGAPNPYSSRFAPVISARGI